MMSFLIVSKLPLRASDILSFPLNFSSYLLLSIGVANRSIFGMINFCLYNVVRIVYLMLNPSTVTSSLYHQRSLNFFHTFIFSLVSNTSQAIMLPIVFSNPKPMAITSAPITIPVLMPIILRPNRKLKTIRTIKTMIPTI